MKNMSNSHTAKKATTKEFLAGWCLLAKFHLHEAAEEDIIFFKSMFDFHTNLHITYITKINNRSNQERQNGWPAVKYRLICILIKYEEKMRLQNSRYLQRLLKSTG